MVKAADKCCFPAFLLSPFLFIPPLRQCGGGCHLGDSSFVLRMWCEHRPRAGYKQVLLSQVIHYKQISYCLCSLGALLWKYTNNRTHSLKLCLSPSLIMACQPILTAPVNNWWLWVMVSDCAQGGSSPHPAFAPLRRMCGSWAHSFHCAEWLPRNKNEH